MIFLPSFSCLPSGRGSTLRWVSRFIKFQSDSFSTIAWAALAFAAGVRAMENFAGSLSSGGVCCFVSCHPGRPKPDTVIWFKLPSASGL